MKKFLFAGLLFSAALSTRAQTNQLGPGPSFLSTLESYIVQNDPAFHGWDSNHFTLVEAAAFASVNGTPGASSVGNMVGLEIPIHKYSIHIDSMTRFEQLAGDVHSQAVGLGYDYAVNQIHLSAGLDAELVFAHNHLQAVPYIELIKMPTTLYGVAPFLRYQYPVSRSPGAGEFLVGLALNL